MSTRIVLPRLVALIALATACDSRDPAAPPAVASIEVDPAERVLVIGESVALTATTYTSGNTPVTGRTVTWSSNAIGVATVSQTGLVTAVGSGTARITAASEGRSATAEIVVRDGGIAPPSGTTITAAAGAVQISVPAGAVSGAVPIEVVPLPEAPPNPQLVTGTSYHIGPGGTTFAVPVTLRIRYQDSMLPTGADPERLRLHRWNGDEWELLPNGAVDAATRTVSGQTSHLGPFAVLLRSPQPVLTATNPTSAPVGADAFTMAITGSNFSPYSVVHWNGSPRPTTWTSATQLVAQIHALDVATPGTAEVTVVTPAPGGGTSAALTFQIVPPNPAPTLTSLSHTAVAQNGAGFTLTITGSSFVQGATVRSSGGFLPATVISSTEIRATVGMAHLYNPGWIPVWVENPPPGGGSSNVLYVRIVPPSIAINAFDDTDDGVCDDHCTLREAINLAHALPEPNREIFIPGMGQVTLTSPLPTLRVPMTIETSSQHAITLDAGGSHGHERRIFTIADTAVVTLRRLTLSGGFHDDGGAIAVRDAASLVLDEVVLRSNHAPNRSGGAVEFTSSGNLHIENTLFEANRAFGSGQPRGGALTVQSPGGQTGLPTAASVVLRNVTFEDNEATVLGGAFYLAGSATGTRTLDRVQVLHNGAGAAGGGGYLVGPGVIDIINSTFAGNRADGDGGALAISGNAVVHVRGSTIADNGSHHGGGVWLSSPTPAAEQLVITNTTFSMNAAVTGGALFLGGGALLRNVTLYGNTAEAMDPVPGGGGIYIGANNVLVRATNVLLAANPADHNRNCHVPASLLNARIESLGGNLSADTTCAAYFTAPGDLNDTAAGIAATVANNGGPTLTHALLAGSPAIDAGNTATCPDTDQRGYIRHGPCDIGAFEAGGLPPAGGTGAGLRSAPRRR